MAMRSGLLMIERARSTVGTSSNEMLTAPKQGIVSTRGFNVILALAFSCMQSTVQHSGHYMGRVTNAHPDSIQKTTGLPSNINLVLAWAICRKTVCHSCTSEQTYGAWQAKPHSTQHQELLICDQLCW